VIYILKENRTYDQILATFRRRRRQIADHVRRRHHSQRAQTGAAIRSARQLLRQRRSFRDGHLWSTASTTSDYNEKTWPIGYRSKERTYDSGGSVADEFPLEQGIPDVDDPGTGFLWTTLQSIT